MKTDLEAQERNKSILPKVFISLPLRNRSEQQVVEAWNTAINQASEAYYHKCVSEDESIKSVDLNIISSLISSIPEDDDEIGNVSVWCLGRSIQKLAQADFVYFAEGWKEARGCLIEYDVATAYDIPIITFEEYKEKQND